MPLYAYNCQNCNTEFELLVRSTMSSLSSCGSEKLQQQVAKICVDIKYPAIAKSWRRARQRVEISLISLSKSCKRKRAKSLPAPDARQPGLPFARKSGGRNSE